MLISEENLVIHGRVLVETWTQRCGTFRFILRPSRSSLLEEYPIEPIEDLPEEHYQHLSDKVRRTLIHLSHKYSRQYQWFLKADHDTYLIVENLLRFLLSTTTTYVLRLFLLLLDLNGKRFRSSVRSLLYGYRFGENGHLSGGASYVLTREGLTFFGEYLDDPWTYSRCNSSMEDLMVKNCLELVFQLAPNRLTKDFTLIGETTDSNGKERFHPLAFRLHQNGPANKTKREWIHFRPFHHNLFVRLYFFLSLNFH